MMVLGVALAGENLDVQTSAKVYELVSASFGGEHVLKITCQIVSFERAADILATKSQGRLWLEWKGPIAALICKASRLHGEPYFLPVSLTYSQQGITHSVSFESYFKLSGDLGTLESGESFEILLLLPQVSDAEAFTLSYGGASVEVEPKQLAMAALPPTVPHLSARAPEYQ